jgi:hypothetical protein
MALFDIDPDTQIMRYMSFASFCSLIISRHLLFRRQDQLEDPYEGKLPEGTYKNYADEVHKLSHLPMRDSENQALLLQRHHQVYTRKYIFVNSWTINDTEDRLMWKSYLGGGKEGVAIQTTAKGLKDSLLNPKKYKFAFGKVSYHQDAIPAQYINRDSIATHKLIAYKSENEYRALIYGFKSPSQRIHAGTRPRPFAKTHLYINVNLDHLIKRVYVTQSDNSWYFKVVESILCQYLNSQEMLVHSSIKERF